MKNGKWKMTNRKIANRKHKISDLKLSYSLRFSPRHSRCIIP